MLKRIWSLALCGMMVPLCAHAIDKTWLEVSTGGGTYAMSDLNREIETYNAANPGGEFAAVNRGLSLGFAAGCQVSNRWNFGLGMDRLKATTRASNSSGATDYNFGANGWRAFAEYGVHATKTTSMRLGFGAGIVAESGKMTISAPDSDPTKDDIKGHGTVFEAYGGGDWWATPQVAIQAAAGYRRAKVGEVQISGGTLIAANGEPVTLDFSGPYLRLGVRVVAKGIQ
jgi:hypothetical protein